LDVLRIAARRAARLSVVFIRSLIDGRPALESEAGRNLAEEILMNLLAWTLVLASAAPAASTRTEARLGELAAAVLSADYRGDRAELARLDAALGSLDAGPLNDYRDYWRGFALWRRAMNGFNETPTPSDLDADLVLALDRFRSALDRRPDWAEARLAMVGSWGNRIFLAGKDEEKRRPILEEAMPTFRWVMQYTGDNPRALWIKGGFQMVVPPESGGDPAKAAATLREGVDCAWREAQALPAAPSWVPTWGGPENLMNLAYMYANGSAPDRALAMAYAQGALTAVPHWHYVRDVLLPKIQALPGPAAAPVPAPAAP
jgi:hypothetical protein